jgi:hypothetical protein
MPVVTIKSGVPGPDGKEDQLTEYLCDSPGCPNVATHALGCIRDLGVAVAVCDEHLPHRPGR